MNFNFGEVLTRAWQIVWKHKNLWLTGFVVGLIGMFPALVSLVLNPSYTSFADPSEARRQLPLIMLVNVLTIGTSFLTIPVYIIGMAVPSLGTFQLERGRETLNVGELIKGVLPYFWRILGVAVLIWLGMFLIMVPFLVCGVLASVVTFGFGMICIIPIMIPLGILVLAMLEQGMAAVVVDNLGVSAALQRAWKLIKKNLGVMFLLGLIIYLGSGIIGGIVSVPMMIPMFQFIFNNMGSEPDIEAMQSLTRNMVWWMVAFSPLYAVLQGILLAFMQSVWTLTYLRLTKPHINTPVIVEANA